MITHINHEPIKNLGLIYSRSMSKCKFCGCVLYYNNATNSILPVISANKCLTYEEKLIKDIIE